MGNTVKDLVCGMDVSTDSKVNLKYEDKLYYFCSTHCLEKFEQAPKSYIENAKQDKGDKPASCCSGH